MPYPCPAGFDRRFIRAYGRQLYDRLVDAQLTDTVSWAEVGGTQLLFKRAKAGNTEELINSSSIAMSKLHMCFVGCSWFTVHLIQASHACLLALGEDLDVAFVH